MSDKTFSAAFNEYADADKCISADSMRDLIEDRTERNLSAKTVRAYLRTLKIEAHQKNAQWRIDKTLAEETVNHFDRKSKTAS